MCIRDSPYPLRILSLLSVEEDEAVEALVELALTLREAPLDAILLDSGFGGRKGGTGVPHDWEKSRRIVEKVAPFPVVLAGGLTPENVAHAVEIVKPYAVDVASGVEDETGAKSERKVQAFLGAVGRGVLSPSEGG